MHLVTCKLIPFFMNFYTAKVTGGMVTFGWSKATKVNIADKIHVTAAASGTEYSGEVTVWYPK